MQRVGRGRRLGRLRRERERGDRESQHGLQHRQILHVVVDFFVAAIESLWLRIGPSFHGLYPDFALNRRGVSNHLAAITALKAGDGAKVRQAMEQDAGASNEGVRLALYFERMAPRIKNAYQLLADKALRRRVHRLGVELARDAPGARAIKRQIRPAVHDPIEIMPLLRREARLEIIADDFRR